MSTHQQYLKKCLLDPKFKALYEKERSDIAMFLDIFDKDLTSIQAIKNRMKELGLKPKDMDPFFGSPADTKAVLSGKMEMTLPMVRRLHRHLLIPLDVLIRPYKNNVVEEIDFALRQSLSHAKGRKVPGVRTQVIESKPRKKK